MVSVNNGVKNEKYRVKHTGISNKNMLHRSGALGLNTGSETSIKRKCLLNGSSVVEVDGQYLSLRQRDARLIILEE